jgi:hypothetical protein
LLGWDDSIVRATRLLSDVPLPMRHVLGGVILLGVVGCFAGLTIGLIVYPPTAWFALFELGIPAGLVGGLLGLVSGLVTMGLRAVRSSRAN